MQSREAVNFERRIVPVGYILLYTYISFYVKRQKTVKIRMEAQTFITKVERNAKS